MACTGKPNCPGVNGYTCFEGGTIEIWISEADYFPFHPDPAPSVWSWDLHVPPPAHAGCNGQSRCTLAATASLKDYKATGKLFIDFQAQSGGQQTLCRQRSIYSDNCVVNTELECINKYTECNDEQEAAWKIKAEKAKYQYAFPSSVSTLDRGTDPNKGICFTSFDGKLVDPVALTYYQATNCLVSNCCVVAPSCFLFLFFVLTPQPLLCAFCF
jgi:hypothetical protein